MFDDKKSKIEKIAKRLSANDLEIYDTIYAPTEVAIPDDCAWANMCLTDDGKIRFYGKHNKQHIFDKNAKECYIESCDGGLSWKKYLLKEKVLGGCMQIPHSYGGANAGKFISTWRGEFGDIIALIGDDSNDSNYKTVIVDETTEEQKTMFGTVKFKYPNGICLRSKKRIILTSQRPRLENRTCNFTDVHISDDVGESWKTVHIEPAPFFEMKKPHKGMRWEQNTVESTVAELNDGTLMLILRTSQDYHYVSYSYDSGDTWSKPVQSIFHGSITMPKLYKLADGRLLMVWCNSQSLPEVEFEKKGGATVFTNRDSQHIAISEDDGKTWKGFREFAINPIRCNTDFRTVGGHKENDRSVHQSEILELPNNKVLIAYGQHPLLRRIIILDIDWIYEKNVFEDFRNGFQNVHTQIYIKGILGGYKGTPDNPFCHRGHCQYNRTSGAILVKSPENDGKESMLIRTLDDKNLVCPKSGAVWNFPISKKGKVIINLKVLGKGLKLSLLDFWMSPCDVYVGDYSAFTTSIDKKMCSKKDTFTQFVFSFDCEKGTIVITSSNNLYREEKLKDICPNGICYLHLQSLSDKVDMKGTLVKDMEFISDN